MAALLTKANKCANADSHTGTGQCYGNPAPIASATFAPPFTSARRTEVGVHEW